MKEKLFKTTFMKLSCILGVSIIIILAYILSINFKEWTPMLGEIFTLLYNLSVSYVVAYVFYLVQVYIPDKEKNDNAMSIIKPDIEALLVDMDTVIKYCESSFKENGDFIVVSENCSIINSDRFIRLQKDIDRDIRKISNPIICKNLDDKFLELITQIEKNIFTKYLDENIKKNIKDNKIYFNQRLDEYKKLSNLLEMYYNSINCE